MLLLAKFWTYLLHFRMEANITNISIFFPYIIPVYENHTFIRGKKLIVLCFIISFKGKILYLEYVTHHSEKLTLFI